MSKSYQKRGPVCGGGQVKVGRACFLTGRTLNGDGARVGLQRLRYDKKWNKMVDADHQLSVEVQEDLLLLMDKDNVTFEAPDGYSYRPILAPARAG